MESSVTFHHYFHAYKTVNFFKVNLGYLTSPSGVNSQQSTKKGSQINPKSRLEGEAVSLELLGTSLITRPTVKGKHRKQRQAGS